MHKERNREPSIVETKLAQLQHIKDNLKVLGTNAVLIQPNVNALNQLNMQKDLNDIWNKM